MKRPPPFSTSLRCLPSPLPTEPWIPPTIRGRIGCFPHSNPHHFGHMSSPDLEVPTRRVFHFDPKPSAAARRGRFRAFAAASRARTFSGARLLRSTGDVSWTPWASSSAWSSTKAPSSVVRPRSRPTRARVRRFRADPAVWVRPVARSRVRKRSEAQVQCRLHGF